MLYCRDLGFLREPKGKGEAVCQELALTRDCATQAHGDPSLSHHVSMLVFAVLVFLLHHKSQMFFNPLCELTF